MPLSEFTIAKVGTAFIGRLDVGLDFSAFRLGEYLNRSTRLPIPLFCVEA